MATTTPTVWKALTKANISDAPGAMAFATATNEQSRSVVLALSGGGYVVAWDEWNGILSGFEPRDVSALYFDVEGNVASGEFLVSLQYLDLDQQAVALAPALNGGFYGAYQTTDAAGANDLENVSAALFPANQTVYSRSDDFREGFGAASVHNDTAPTITSFSDGSYIVVFENDFAGNKDLTGYSVSSTGTRSVLTTFVANASDDVTPKLATLADQNYVLVYGSGGNISFKIGTKALGNVTTGTIANAASTESAPAVAALKGGGFVVVWQDSAADGASNAGVRARVFTSSGAAVTASFVVPTTVAGVQDQPAVTALADGGFLVAWHDAARSAVYGQRYSNTGVKIGVEFTVAQLNDVSEPSLSLLADGRVLVSVTNNNAGNKDIYQTILDPRDSVINGTAGNDTITSRNDGATINGLGGTDVLLGRSGADTLDGGTGADTMKGRAGNDTYVIDNAGDVADETGGAGLDTVRSSVTFSLSDTVHAKGGIEKLTLTGSAVINGTGTTGANTLDGQSNTAANVLTGLAGDDLYIVGAGDTISETTTGGVDRVVSSKISIDLASYANVENAQLTGTLALTAKGNAGVNTLYGESNSAANKLTGLAGNDIYVVGGGDTIVEEATGGVDLVQSSTISLDLAAYLNVENVQLLGTLALTAKGNDGANVITGDTNTAANALIGLGGNDLYIVDALDTITETSTGGSDWVQSATTNLDLSKYKYVESARLTGTLALTATGDANANTLSGEVNTAINTLTGLGGNDVYGVGAGDIVVEANGGGTDRVQSSSINLDLNLAAYAYVENILLTGTAGLSATGNSGANVLGGNTGANRIDGRSGNDTLTGGAGADSFVFSTALGAANIDTVADFVAGDRLELKTAIFAKIGATLEAGEFRSGAGIVTAGDANDYLIYNTTTGDLYYDADGSGGVSTATKFATLSNKAALAVGDFLIT